jgi:hypothetical protein
MSKNVTYDFRIDSIVAVDAPIGTDPETLIEQAKQKLIQRIQEDDVTFVFENIYDNETGAYDEDWENYSRNSQEEFITTEAITNSDDIPMALPLENLIKIKAWQNMYNAHGEHNYEWEHYPESAHHQIKLMDLYYSQAERIVMEEVEKKSSKDSV